MNKKLESIRYKTASGRDCYALVDAEPEFLKEIGCILQLQFGFAQQGKPLIGLDQIFVDYVKEDILLYACWDCWFGCHLSAEQPAGDEHVLLIGNYLDIVLASIDSNNTDKKLKSAHSKTVGGRDCYEIADAKLEFLKKIDRILELQFGFAFTRRGEPLSVPAEIELNYAKGDILLYLAWDIWTGCRLYAEQPAGDEHILRIGNYLDTVLDTLY